MSAAECAEDQFKVIDGTNGWNTAPGVDNFEDVSWTPNDEFSWNLQLYLFFFKIKAQIREDTEFWQGAAGRFATARDNKRKRKRNEES